MLKRILFPILFVFVFTFSANLKAQERIIHGTVTTFDSIPLIGATITVKSTKQEVLTDSLGNFSVGCSKDDKLRVTAEGFYSQNVKLTGNIKYAAVNLKLRPGEKARELAIGYGHVADADKLNAVTNLNNGDTDFSRYSNIFDLIKGRLAGVQVSNGEIHIRGTTSIISSNAALIIVDGIQVNSSMLSSIPPINVKSINVIKDASAAIYGSRGANGVVIIETKTGRDN